MLYEEVKKTWEKNALEWIRLMEEEMITSRKFTNPAIIESILDQNPEKVLDLGCGEGWLVRELSHSGISCTGIDASTLLIENAQTKGKQNFLAISYEEIIENPKIQGIPFDAIIFNFSLFLKEETEVLLKSLKVNLSPKGYIFIQSIHPTYLFKNSLPYKSQWIADSWAGLNGDFTDPHPWFLRTFSDWIKLFNTCGLELISLKEPTNNELQPVSVIFVLQPLGRHS
jgi:2-polyprenyl-3-methyl-5-hydroxy-6-metoxy-1,4-benzoquinol methylase